MLALGFSNSVQNAEFDSKLNKLPVLANEIAIEPFRNAGTKLPCLQVWTLIWTQIGSF